MKILHLDIESTGIDANKNAIIQLAGAIEINGAIKEEFDIKIRPFPGAVVDPKALEVHGITVDEMMTWPDQHIAHRQFTDILSKYVNKFDREDKFTPCGYAARFDCEFIGAFFNRCGDKYWGAWQNWRIIDIMSVVYWLRSLRIVPELINYKLVTVCEYFGIPLPEAHDALADIRATIALKAELDNLLCNARPTQEVR